MLTPNEKPHNSATRPFFSVIIPTLGKIEGWQLAIQSVLDQTCRDFEIIAIDSGNEKESKPIAEYFNDPRIVYLNTGGKDPRLNWDAGFRASQGNYIIWAEDDNYLLSNELETFKQLIKKTGADLVTGEHIHWRGFQHPLKHARNHLVVRKNLFSGEIERLNIKNAILRIFNLPHKGRFASLHFSGTAVKQELVKKLLKRINEINFGTTGSHALRIGLLAFSENAYHIDRPFVIVGQSGTSMSDVWPKPFSKIKRPEFEFTLSPISGNTYTNYRMENHLLIKKYLPHELSVFSLDYPQFIRTYLRELAHLDMPWKKMLEKWRELFTFTKNSKDSKLIALKKETNLFFIRGLVIKILRTVRVFEPIKNILETMRTPKGGIEISLDSYGVTNIRECAKKLPEIIKKEIPELAHFFPN